MQWCSRRQPAGRTCGAVQWSNEKRGEMLNKLSLNECSGVIDEPGLVVTI